MIGSVVGSILACILAVAAYACVIVGAEDDRWMEPMDETEEVLPDESR